MFDRTVGAHSLAAAGQRESSAHQQPGVDSIAMADLIHRGSTSAVESWISRPSF
jgi:hypothetical protein